MDRYYKVQGKESITPATRLYVVFTFTIFNVNPVTTTTFYDDNTNSSFNSYRLYVDRSVVSILQVEVAVKSEIEHCCYCIYRNIRCLTFGAEYHKTI